MTTPSAVAISRRPESQDEDQAQGRLVTEAADPAADPLHRDRGDGAVPDRVDREHVARHDERAPDGPALIPNNPSFDAYRTVIAQPTQNAVSFVQLALNSLCPGGR